MSDIVYKLDGLAIGMAAHSLGRDTVSEAAREIERLRAERDAIVIERDIARSLESKLVRTCSELRAERDALLDENERLLAQNDAATIYVLTRQRDALLAACKECVAVAERGGQDDDWHSITMARAAIKQAEGEG
jgi:hypothetical protein